ncbi:uncharacterized protein TM35_000301060 [Trypanosoma theileri]|uniref:Uncharacterized protein n=1 Tax=Trypanosoma theileri TaxID=67003 RepID=A0A1X0NMX3_9TRYP|nr:uncharacterized protein TM35_000301060 [Trypanosoma theileri]ORC86066.1 hypothetical protein TM35_000301060 [Trypanosoma theileri]
MIKTALSLALFVVGRRLYISFLIILFLLDVPYVSLGVFADSDAKESVTPGVRFTLPPVVEGILPYIVEMVAKSAIPTLKVSLGGSMPPKNSSWMKLNSWVVIASVILGVLLLATIAITVYFVRRDLQRVKYENDDVEGEEEEDVAEEEEDVAEESEWEENRSETESSRRSEW